MNHRQPLATELAGDSPIQAPNPALPPEARRWEWDRMRELVRDGMGSFEALDKIAVERVSRPWERVE